MGPLVNPEETSPGLAPQSLPGPEMRPSQDSLLSKHRPDLADLPTTNGDHCTGDGLKMSAAVGADLVDLEWVQVHPTGLVHPKEPDAKARWASVLWVSELVCGHD